MTPEKWEDILKRLNEQGPETITPLEVSNLVMDCREMYMMLVAFVGMMKPGGATYEHVKGAYGRIAADSMSRKYLADCERLLDKVEKVEIPHG